MDDEYFRLVISSRHETDGNAAAHLANQAAMRRLARRESQAFRVSFLSAIRPAACYTPGGVFLGTAPSYDVDFTRTDRVSRRVFSGLYYHHFGHSAAPDYQVTSFCFDGLGMSPDSRVGFNVAEIVQAVTDTQCFEVAPGVFRYWFRAPPEEPRASAWVAEYFGSTRFLGVIANRQVRCAIMNGSVVKT